MNVKDNRANIIGINAFHGDSSACLFKQGKLVAAVEEERFRRVKHWAGFPSQAIAYCLESNDLDLTEVDIIAINTNPAHARMKKMAYALTGPASLSLLKEKLRTRKKRLSVEQHLKVEFPKQSFFGRIVKVEHHLAHLASAFYASGFGQSAVVSVDGFGDFASSAWGFGHGVELDVHERVYFPHSLGIFYQAMTQYLGFNHYGDEYKVMGLAPYGAPVYSEKLESVLQTKSNGHFALNLDFFRHHKEAIGYDWDGGSPKVSRLYTSALEELFGPSRTATENLEQKHMDLAHSVQLAYEKAFFNLLDKLHLETNSTNLCIAGGCGMNSVANGKIHLKTKFENIYVQPAAGDAGGAIGAALQAANESNVSMQGAMPHAFWGPSFADSDIKLLLDECSEQLSQCSIELIPDEAQLVDNVSESIIQAKVIGWFQGAMEWGPRALGNRSILADPRRHDMKDIINSKIKRRESFRPFAPSILREFVSEWFESDADVPFMMKVFQVKLDKRESIPAVTHVDGSGRLQTVTEKGNARYYRLIRRFAEKTSVPMLLNTSFNENEPVVCHPKEALDCFLRTDMDVLVLNSYVIKRLT